MSELERQLTALGRELDWPETPDLVTRVSTRMSTPAPAHPPAPARLRRPLPAPGFRRALALAAVGMLVLAGGVFAAVPNVRDAVLEFFGLQGATVERREQLPAIPDLRPLNLGERTTLARARDSLGFDPLVPGAAGPPDGVYVVGGMELSLAYRPRPGLPEARSTRLGLLVSQFRGDLAPEYVGKIAGEATRIEQLRIGGEEAIWMEGAPHVFFYRRPDGSYADEGFRIAENVLLLERGNLLVRFEGAFGRERALRLARSLR